MACPRFPLSCSYFWMTALEGSCHLQKFTLVTFGPVTVSSHPESGSFSGFLHSRLVLQSGRCYLLGMFSVAGTWGARSSICERRKARVSTERNSCIGCLPRTLKLPAAWMPPQTLTAQNPVRLSVVLIAYTSLEKCASRV